MTTLSELIAPLLSKYRVAANKVFIAYSGGVDSHVLLHLCAAQISNKEKLCAVYVHHGIQAEADEWAQHCAAAAGDLGVRFIQIDVNGLPESGESPEEAARNARYQALKKLLNPDDVLLTGQHREDQLETILLQLFRGAGLSGLSGMPEVAGFGKGKIIRPLLDIGSDMIESYAQQHQLVWIEDPSNKNNAYNRNYLRNRVIPKLKERWPAIDKTVSRAGKHCADAHEQLAEIADDLLPGVFNQEDQTLSIERLLQYHRYAQQQIIRAWFRRFNLRMPATGMVEKLLNEVIAARQDAAPQLHCNECEIRRYRNKLYLLAGGEAVDPDSSMHWPGNALLLSLPNNGRLVASVTAAAGITREVWDNAQITVRYRSGGEKIRLPNRTGKQSLKKLFQEAGVPPWVRKNTPLIYFDGVLAAVGGHWICADFFTSHPGSNIQLQWQPMDSFLKDHDESNRVD